MQGEREKREGEEVAPSSRGGKEKRKKEERKKRDDSILLLRFFPLISVFSREVDRGRKGKEKGGRKEVSGRKVRGKKRRREGGRGNH